MVDDAPDIKEVLPKFLDFVKGCILVAHNANFDVGFIRKNAADLGIENEVPRTYADTMEMARLLLRCRTT
jgi:DNA polymerase-3 subunit alpha (Gram-positive type)